MTRPALVLLLGLALACWPTPAAAADRDCGAVTARGTSWVAFVVSGGLTCDEARGVIAYVLTNPPASMGSPGRPPPGWTCGWGYQAADGRTIGRSGPACETLHGARVDGRPVTVEGASDPWPFPVARPIASSDAQAFMPLIFLDDDEHWPLSNPDWYLHTANVLHCPTGKTYGGCRRFGPVSITDPTLGYLRFDPEEARTGAPASVYVHQTEPGQPAIAGGPVISPVYRFFDYWWFYPYNRGPYGWSAPVAGNHDHLSDWEGATVAVNPARPVDVEFIAMSAHEAAWNYLPGVLRCGEQQLGDARHETPCGSTGRRVNVYPAEGTHANFPRRCDASVLDLLKRGICVQTGLTQVLGKHINLPEGRFNGKDDAPSLIPTTSLMTLDAIGPSDWTNYAGFWDLTGDVGTPNTQGRFKDPLNGKRQCTRRWQGGPNEATPCTGEFRRPTAARLQRVAAAAQGVVDPCEDWFGPIVAVCQPETLRAALAAGTLNEAGSLRVGGGPGESDVAPGIGQVVDDPIVPGRPVEVFGSGEAVSVRVRAQADGQAIDARFDSVALAPDTPLRVRVSRGGAVRGSLAGRSVRPTATRRHNVRRPATLRRVSARRRSGGSVLIRFPRVSGRVEIELRRTRGGRPLTSLTVSGRRGSARVLAPRGARFVVARRLSATFIPSRVRVARIR